MIQRAAPYLFGTIFLAVLLPTLFQRTDRTDLHILVQAAHRWMAGEPVYRLEDANEHTKPPLATLLFVPLSQVPLHFLARFWDLLNLLTLGGLVFLFLRDRAWAMGLGAVWILLNPFNAELRMGQYNGILFLGLIAAGFARSNVGTGFALVLALLFKPTFILMLPWSLRQVPKPVVSLGVAGSAGLFLAGIYSLVAGVSGLVGDFQTWARFLPLSSAKHLLRPDNFGLPALWAAAGYGNAETAFLALGMVLSTWAAWKFSDRLAGLSVIAVLMVVTTPMAWLQNYLLLLPAVIWALEGARREKGPASALLVLALAVLWLGVGAVSPTTCAWVNCGRWVPSKFPLVCLLATVALSAVACCGICVSGTSPLRSHRGLRR